MSGLKFALTLTGACVGAAGLGWLLAAKWLSGFLDTLRHP